MSAGPFRDDAVLLTGASRGIGRSIALRFAEEGARLALAARAKIPVVVADIGTNSGEYVSFVISDNYQGAHGVGEALAAYLRHGRPGGVQNRSVFIRVKAPRGPLTRGAVTQIVAHAGRRAGVEHATPHALRHTAATELLRAGAPALTPH